jgi:predicted ester cyclase
MRHEVEVASVDATAVTVRFTIHGTHRAPFFGIPATGKSVRVVANVILRVSEGRVAELFGVFDEAGMLRQLGVLPS